MGNKRIHRYGMSRLGDAALWASVSTAVLTLHMGAIVWMLHEAPDALAEPAPQAAIMLDFSAEPEAILTEENNITPDMQSSQEQAEVKPAEEPPAPDIEPVVEQEQPPEPEPVVETPEEPLPEPPPVQEKAEAVLPPPPPPKKIKPEPKKPDVKPEPRRTPPKERVQEKQRKPAPATAAATAASAQAKQSNRNAASQTAAGMRSSSVSPARWQSQLMAHLERRKRFPAGATGKSGIAHVRFTIDGNGRVLSSSLARTSGVPAFDEEVVALVKRASPLPAPPEGKQRTIVVPVKFARGR